MISSEFCDILRCPACVKEHEGSLSFYKDSWLICSVCSRKYPIVDEIPVMLIEEGEKWISVSCADLPVPPPQMK